MAVAIISGAFLRIGEACIGLVDLLELGFAILTPGIFVRMEFHRQFAIGGLEHLLVGGALHLE